MTSRSLPLLLSLLLAPALASAQATGLPAADSRPPDRAPANRGFGLRLGGITPLDPTGQGSGTGVGFFWQYDAGALIVDLGAEGYWGRHYHDASVGFGAVVPLLAANATPYLGGGLRYAWARFEGDWSSGLQPQAVAGFMIGRLSSVQVRAEVAWFYATFRTNQRNANGLLWTAAVVF